MSANPRNASAAFALCAGFGYLVASLVVLAVWYFPAVERNAGAMDRLGEQLADDLAYHAVEAMLRDDRIRLGLLANRLERRSDVRGVEIYGIDGSAMVVAGNPRPDDAVYVREAATLDTAAGHVRVTLNADVFHVSIRAFLAETWAYVAGGLVLAMGIAYTVARLALRPKPSPLASEPSEGPAEPEPERAFVLVAAPFPRGGSKEASSDTPHRDETIAEQVANLYAGEVRQWPGGGVALVFPATASEDRAFEVVCAALLAQRLLTGPFRFGLDLVPTGDDEAPPLHPVAILASFAPDGGLVVGRDAYAAIRDDERLQRRPLQNSALKALSGDAVPEAIIDGTDESHEALIAEQADMIAAA